MAAFVDQVFVCVNELCFRMLINFICDPKQGILRQLLVVIEQADKFDGREFQCGIRGGRNVSIGLSKHEFDPAVTGSVFFEKRLHMLHSRSVIGDAQLPIWVELLFDGFYAQLQPFLVCVINWKKERYKRSLL